MGTHTHTRARARAARCVPGCLALTASRTSRATWRPAFAPCSDSGAKRIEAPFEPPVRRCTKKNTQRQSTREIKREKKDHANNSPLPLHPNYSKRQKRQPYRNRRASSRYPTRASLGRGEKTPKNRGVRTSATHSHTPYTNARIVVPRRTKTGP